MAVPITDAQLRGIVETYRRLGLNVSATSRELGLARQTIQKHLRSADARGMLTGQEVHGANAPNRDAYMSARASALIAFQRKQRKGSWRNLVNINLPDRPFRLKVFGDPHLDADGCNFALFERHWLEMDPEAGVYGVCVGDWFNNWTRSLAHLYRDEQPASDAWVLFEGLMAERGEGLLAACSGNHDDWTHGPADPIEMLMRQHGVAYRNGAIRVALKCGDHDPLTVAIRHKWRGQSMYSKAHGIVRAFTFNNWYDDIAIGGHIHTDEPRMWTCPETGRHAHLCQVSAFKEYDVHDDTQGFGGAKISPVWDLVCDPSAPSTDPDKVKVFWDSRRAAAYHAALLS